MLIAGDSHPKRAINPVYFKNAKNISQYAEPYVLTYWKLKEILKYNKFDTLLLGFSPHNISNFNDYKFYDPKWSGEMFKRSYPIEEFNKIDNQIEIDYKKYYNIIMRQFIFYPIKNHNNFIGSYSNSKKSSLDNLKGAVKRHYFWKNNTASISKISVSYLDSIINLCGRNKIKIILVSSPVHESYLNKIPLKILSKYKSLKNIYNNHIIIDQLKTQYPDTFYRNPDHLNKYGANKFSKYLYNTLNKKKDYN